MANNAQLDHYHSIVEQEKAVRKALLEWTEAKDEASACKKNFDRLNDELLDMIHGGPDWQNKLPFDEGEEE